MKYDRLYIAGAGGMLGEAFYRLLADKCCLECTDIDVNTTWLRYCDVRDREEYERSVAAFSPDILFHFAALTDLEFCETHVDDAYCTNTLAVENAVWIANKRSIPLVYIGTAGIFDGTKDVYDDWDEPSPMGRMPAPNMRLRSL